MTNVLIVEDELISAITLEAFLQDEGYTVKHAASGCEALRTVSTFLPDILISDWKLKDEVDGIEVAKEIKRLNPELKTIFYSGMGIEEMRAKSQGMEVYHFLSKPCGLEEMLGIVRKAIAPPTSSPLG